MKLLRRQPLLLLLALLVGQWLTALHAGEHPLLEGASPHSCVACLHAQSGGAVPPNKSLFTLAILPQVAPETTTPAATAHTQNRVLSIRGPPAHFA